MYLNYKAGINNFFKYLFTKITGLQSVAIYMSIKTSQTAILIVSQFS